VKLETLLWADFDRTVKHLTYYVSREWGFEIENIVGRWRGGLPLAVALSHALKLPLVTGIGPRTLYVTDVYYGDRPLPAMAPLYTVAWGIREPMTCPDGLYAVYRVPADTWAVFPWTPYESSLESMKRFEKNKR